MTRETRIIKVRARQGKEGRGRAGVWGREVKAIVSSSLKMFNTTSVFSVHVACVLPGNFSMIPGYYILA